MIIIHLLPVGWTARGWPAGRSPARLACARANSKDLVLIRGNRVDDTVAYLGRLLTIRFAFYQLLFVER